MANSTLPVRVAAKAVAVGGAASAVATAVFLRGAVRGLTLAGPRDETWVGAGDSTVGAAGARGGLTGTIGMAGPGAGSGAGATGKETAAAGGGMVSYALLGDAGGGFWLYGSVVVAVAVGGLMAALHAVQGDRALDYVLPARYRLVWRELCGKVGGLGGCLWKRCLYL